jgi:3,4-dihydroxy 2-butanone 4-phosphate synthase/GTP cyclohydrolase II
MHPFIRFLSEFKTKHIGVLIDDLSGSRAAIVAPSETISAERVNHILALTGGLTFVALSPERASTFMLSSMARPATSLDTTANNTTTSHYVSVEAREGITTGISAADRAKTLSILGARTPQPRALVKPGHIFPVATRDGGVLVKTDIPEGALDLVRLAGFTDAALYVDLLDRNGELVGADEARRISAAEGMPVTTLSELIGYRLAHESLVRRVAEATLPTTLAGEVRAIVYRSSISDVEHVALAKGTFFSEMSVLVRVQPEHTVADVFGGASPASRLHLQNSLAAIGQRGSGVLLYLRRPFIDPKGSSTQHLREDSTSPKNAAMMREYGVGAQILRDLGISKVEILSSTQRALEGLSSFGISVVALHPIPSLISSEGHTV